MRKTCTFDVSPVNRNARITTPTFGNLPACRFIGRHAVLVEDKSSLAYLMPGDVNKAMLAPYWLYHPKKQKNLRLFVSKNGIHLTFRVIITKGLSIQHFLVTKSRFPAVKRQSLLLRGTACELYCRCRLSATTLQNQRRNT